MSYKKTNPAATTTASASTISDAVEPSPVLLRFVDVTHVNDAEHHLRAAEDYLAEATKLPEARLLAEHLRPIATRLRAEHDRCFRELVPALVEAACPAHATAVAHREAATAAHHVGSVVAEEALKLRDDLEIAMQAERVRTRELEAAASAVRSSLSRITLKDPHREGASKMMEALEARCSRGEAHLDDRWTDADPASILWEPLFAARVRARAKDAGKAHAKWTASKDFDHRIDPRLLDIERFDGMLGALRAQRAAKRQRLEQELTKLQAATT